MSSPLIIRIFGGVFGGAIGTYISGRIYDFLYIRPQPPLTQPPLTQPPLTQPSTHQNKKEIKSFEQILENKVKTTNDYEYDNEYGNTIDFNYKKEDETIFINDALYDNSFFDFYESLFSYENRI
jgi:hypothetical protein